MSQDPNHIIILNLFQAVLQFLTYVFKSLVIKLSQCANSLSVDIFHLIRYRTQIHRGIEIFRRERRLNHYRLLNWLLASSSIWRGVS